MNVQELDRETSKEMQHCIDNCLDCFRVCAETLTYCLETGSRRFEPEHLKVLQDCVEICQVSAHFMIRGSDLHKHTCAVCSAVCDRCAEACERFEEDEMMMACAEACRHCAESCKDMAASEHNKELFHAH